MGSAASCEVAFEAARTMNISAASAYHLRNVNLNFLKEFSIEQICILSNSDTSILILENLIKKKSLPYFKGHKKLKQLPGEHPRLSQTHAVPKCGVCKLNYSMYKQMDWSTSCLPES